MAEFSNYVDDNEDILGFLDFSVAAAENELTDTMHDAASWEFADEQSQEMGPEAGGWVVQAMPLDCRECVVLRELVHSNGVKNMRLSIHGSVGKFYHATLNDTVSAFFDALCARMGNGDFHSPADHTGLCQIKPATVNDGACRTSKSGIAAQRERTGKLHINDLADYFHLPISEAAKELRICSTALKKICRKHGMSRWPHRKIKSIDRRISNLLRDFHANNEEEALNAQAEIEQLRAQRDRICAGLPP